MRRIVARMVLAAAMFAGLRHAPAWGGFLDEKLDVLAAQAASDDGMVAARAISWLRDAGQAGLDAMFTVHAAAIQRALENGSEETTPDSESWSRLRHALDQVGGQRDCHASHLFWHTDLATARAVAKQEGKPILSLRLLGKLTDEYSCANSRFFRSTLYANQAVGKLLRERFVLHWQSVRPAPLVTIDFGDGRKLLRTVTGNSVHYVLDSNGRVVDALPGLYGPQAFLRGLEQAEQIARETATIADSAAAARRLSEYHQARLNDLRRAWDADLRKLGIAATDARSLRPAVRFATNAQTRADQPRAEVAPRADKVAPRADKVAPRADKAAPRADKAAGVAQPKGMVEAPIVAAVLNLSDEALSAASTDQVWAQIAALHGADVELDAATWNFIARQQPSAAEAASKAFTKAVVESPLVRLVSNLQQAIALDTVRNEYLLHRQIHVWFVGRQVGNLTQLNERVYAELFLTPNSDPWLGLVPADTYSGLECNGVTHCPHD